MIEKTQGFEFRSEVKSWGRVLLYRQHALSISLLPNHKSVCAAMVCATRPKEKRLPLSKRRWKQGTVSINENFNINRHVNINNCQHWHTHLCSQTLILKAQRPFDTFPPVFEIIIINILFWDVLLLHNIVALWAWEIHLIMECVFIIIIIKTYHVISEH